MAIGLWAGLGVGLSGPLAGCDDSAEVHVTDPSNGSDDASVEPSTDAADAASGSDAGSMDAADVDQPDAPLVPVSVGVVPVPQAGDDGVVDPIEHTIAHLEVIAAGSPCRWPS